MASLDTAVSSGLSEQINVLVQVPNQIEVLTNPSKHQSHTITQTNEMTEAAVDQQLLCSVR